MGMGLEPHTISKPSPTSQGMDLDKDPASFWVFIPAFKAGHALLICCNK